MQTFIQQNPICDLLASYKLKLRLNNLRLYLAIWHCSNMLQGLRDGTLSARLHACLSYLSTVASLCGGFAAMPCGRGEIKMWNKYAKYDWNTTHRNTDGSSRNNHHRLEQKCCSWRRKVAVDGSSFSSVDSLFHARGAAIVLGVISTINYS